MRHIRLLTAAALVAALPSGLPRPAWAQGQDWFVPGQARGGQPSQPLRAGSARSGPSVRPPAPTPVPAVAGPQGGAPTGAAEPDAPTPQVQVQLPPAPDVPALPKSAPPPGAVIGVLGLSDISRASAAAQQVDKVLNERMTKLHDDAQKEQAAWREVQQQLASQRGGLTPDQIRGKERELQERVTNAQRQFRDRNRVIQEAAQYAKAQIERTLQQIVIQVAESRGINLVLHQEQVVLNYPGFDITQPVVEQLNKILPAVIIPPDGVAVSQMPGAVPVPPAAPAAQAAPPVQAAPAVQAQGPAAVPPAPPAASAAPSANPQAAAVVPAPAPGPRAGSTPPRHP